MQEKLGQYQLKSFWKAPKSNCQKKSDLTYKEFNEGDVFVGFEYDGSLNKERVTPVIIAMDGPSGYIVPKEKVIKLADISSEDAKKYDMRYKGGQIQQEIDRIKSKNLVKDIVNVSKGSMKGAMWGLGFGIVTALYFKKNIFAFSAIGAIGGGYIGKKFLSSTPKKEEENKTVTNKNITYVKS